MPERLLADGVLLLHFGFLAFVVCGALIVWRWPRVCWVHLPALAWGAYVVLAGEICPLTPLENALRQAGGGGAYEDSFIEHYLLPLIYPGAVQGPTGRALQVALGVALLVFNAWVYALLWRRHAARQSSPAFRTAGLPPPAPTALVSPPPLPMPTPAPTRTATPADEPQRHFGRPIAGWRLRMYIVIFEADTVAGRRFDLALIATVLASVAVVLLDSVAAINAQFGGLFAGLEIGFTALFTLEYIARLICVRRPLRYARSFFGVIDLLAVLPTYLALLVPGLHALIDVRILRLLRIFRVLKLGAYVAEYRALGQALSASRRKITVFLVFVMMVVLVMGTMMYLVEGPENGFTSIPMGIYWAIVTMTTVGYGDLVPKTDIGRFIASLQMLLGWGILAVPTGIVSAEFTARRVRGEPTTRTCHECLSEGHEAGALFCKDCGARLPPRHSEH